jgi:hypothetical protein
MPEEVKTEERLVAVMWYTCDCPWTTKFCDDFHTSRARVPVSVLEKYKSTT